MIVGYHCIFGMYGFWLPNDPRGSWSDFVGSWNLFRYGSATKTTARTSVARLHGLMFSERNELLSLWERVAAQRPGEGGLYCDSRC